MQRINIMPILDIREFEIFAERLNHAEGLVFDWYHNLLGGR